ncbi:Methyltransferase domain-containing protein [Thiothrix caldifontis]|uniref:Methyltransferase domain-containing protein n=1 Tax=Thiothrix caldifontis TaxID=525918 RepID=A0A1H3ZW09_9GAMM|nr:methyltransferase domain-containing protein [Thiothrix caldifontis]SEA27850.1 Methyltransferase domain-containing protein [Thiothrix caldifontis]
MINWLHSKWHRPEKGWDPVDPAWALEYAEAEWRMVDHALLDTLEAKLGGLAGKRVLDMGAGAGQYSVALAQRGADVTWHDISRTYRTFAQAKAADAGVTLHWSLGYLEETQALPAASFDLIFNRICWYYCQNDQAFARQLWGLLKPAGVLYIHTPNSQFHGEGMPTLARLRTWLNAQTGFKVGHPMLPPRRVANLFAALPISRLEADYRDPRNDVIWVWKVGGESHTSS